MQLIVIKYNFEIVKSSDSFKRLLSNNKLKNKRFINEIFEFSKEDLEKLLFCGEEENYSIGTMMKGSGEQFCITLIHSSKYQVELLITQLYLQYEYKKNACSRIFNNDYLFESLAISNIVVWNINSQEKRLFFTDEIENILNIPNSKSLSWCDLKSLIHKKDRGLFRNNFISNLELNNKSSCVVRVNSNFGVKWIEITGIRKERIENDKVLHSYFGIIRDCSVEQISMRELDEANEWKRLALEVGNIGKWRAIKLNGRWEWDWDKRFNCLFELEIDDFGNLEKWANKLDRNDLPRVLSALEVSLNTGSEFNESFSVILNNHKVIQVLAKGIVMKRNDIYRIDGIVIDETKTLLYQSELKKQVQEKTEELNKALANSEKISSAKSDFLSMMSHELRTPMNAIISSLELMSLSKQRSFEENDLINTANNAAQNLVQILNDILDLNKVEAGRLELDYSDFDFSSMIQSVLTMFSDSAWQQNVEINLSESLNLPMFIQGDEVRIKQIIFNLLSNAIKFSANQIKKGNVLVSVNFEASHHIPHNLKISVKDNGIGIPKEIQKKLFTPFVQAERSTTRKYGGTGLGLAISGRLLELMGGQFELNSEVGKGSEFTISIPIWSFKENKYCLNIKAKLINFNQRDEEILISKLRYLGCEIVLNDSADVFFLAIYRTEDLDKVKSLFNLVVCYFDKKILKGSRGYLNNPHVLISECTYHRLKSVINLCKQSNISSLEEERVFIKEKKQISVEQEQSKILLVEDNLINQKLIAKQLVSLGHCCDVANNGYQGFEKFKVGVYAIILTDCHMPDMDGYQLTRAIRVFEKEQNLKRIPIIAVTGAAMSGDRDLCEESGMDDFLSKPISLQKLKTIIDRWLND